MVDPVTRNDGTRGEQGSAFILGEAGYMIVDGPSGAGGHAANAHGPDGVAYNPSNGDFIIYDVKDFLAKHVFTPGPQLVDKTVYAATALVENFNTKWFDQIITKVVGNQTLPQRAVILQRLAACRAALSSGRNWPQNTRVAVIRMGGGASGVGPRLRAMNVTFIDLTTDPIVTNAAAAVRGAKLWKEISDLVDRTERQIALYKGEHQLQLGLLTRLDMSSVSGAAATVTGMLGAAANLFNAKVPELMLWQNAEVEIPRARRLLREGQLVQAYASASLAAQECLAATYKFTRWKEGLLGGNGSIAATTKMQIAIPLLGVAIVGAMFGGMAIAGIIAPGMAGMGATGTATAAAGTIGAAEAATVARITATVAAAERRLRVAETAVEVIEEELEVLRQAVL